MVSRRGFLTGMLALGAAPAIVRAESLMRLWVPPQTLMPMEIGRYEGFRFITSDALPDELTYYVDRAAMNRDYTAYCEAWRRDNNFYIRSVRYEP